jgi:hypothetical protein
MSGTRSNAVVGPHGVLAFKFDDPHLKVGCIKEIRIIDAERHEFRLIFSVTVSSNEAQHILI